MTARVVGGTYCGGTEYIVECPYVIPGEGPCEADLDVEELSRTWTIPAACSYCGSELRSGLRDAVIEAAEDAMRNYEPPEPDMNAVSFAERVELENRKYRGIW